MCHWKFSRLLSTSGSVLGDVFVLLLRVFGLLVVSPHDDDHHPFVFICTHRQRSVSEHVLRKYHRQRVNEFPHFSLEIPMRQNFLIVS
jgi:hypothetical protein